MVLLKIEITKKVLSFDIHVTFKQIKIKIAFTLISRGNALGKIIVKSSYK